MIQETFLPPQIEMCNRTVFILGYGAIGTCVTDMILKHIPNVKLIVCDIFDHHDERFEYFKLKVDKNNMNKIFEILKPGDILLDLSTSIRNYEVWELAMKNKVMYLNTALELWDDSDRIEVAPKKEDLWYYSLDWDHHELRSSDFWNSDRGTTSIIEHGMNPGMVSHFAKKGLLEAAEYFLKSSDFDDLNKEEVQKYLTEKNYPKLARSMGLHTIHCSESDEQLILENPPTDTKTKIYNTWSCKGLLSETLCGMSIGAGQHETPRTFNDELVKDQENSIIATLSPARFHYAKSWVPNKDIEGCLILHGESFSLRDYFTDIETGYKPSAYFVYDINYYTKEFMNNLSLDFDLTDEFPQWEVLNPTKWKLNGADKVGALLIFKNNRGWWSGSIMDHSDASQHFENRYGPTVLQVAGGVFSAFCWMVNNPDQGNKWAEEIDSDFVMNIAKPYLGTIWSGFVDLNNTHLKDCYIFEDFHIFKK